MQSGRHAGAMVLRRLAGLPTRPFRYHDKGTMATIGRRAAVADLRFGVTLRGTVAWLAWLFLHLIYLMGFRNRAQVLLQWAWNYLTWNWGPRLILDPEADRSPPRPPPPRA
jgi:NADH dehydrogenase